MMLPFLTAMGNNGLAAYQTFGAVEAKTRQVELFVDKNVYQAAEWIANVKPAHVPGLTCRAVLYDEPGSTNTTQCFLQIVDLDREIWHRCTRPTFAGDADLRSHFRGCRERHDPALIHYNF
jgi:hypothetical protein